MTCEAVINWMLSKLEADCCLYQDDVVDLLMRSKNEKFLRENADGNQVLGREVLTAFKKETVDSVVWVKPEKYWRFRVSEDEPGRDARG